MTRMGATRATISAPSGTPRSTAAGIPITVMPRATTSANPNHEPPPGPSPRTAASRARPRASTPAPMKTSEPMNATAVKASSTAGLAARAARVPTSQATASAGRPQRMSVSWISSSASRAWCAWPRYTASAPIQPPGCALSASMQAALDQRDPDLGSEQPAQGASGDGDDRESERLPRRGAPPAAPRPAHPDPGQDGELERTDDRDLAERGLHRGGDDGQPPALGQALGDGQESRRASGTRRGGRLALRLLADAEPVQAVSATTSAVSQSGSRAMRPGRDSCPPGVAERRPPRPRDRCRG